MNDIARFFAIEPGWAWLIVAAILFVLDVLTAFTVGMLPPLLPLVAADWALSPVKVGLVNTLYAIGRLVGSYPASLMRARWGTRAVVFIGLGGLVAGCLLCAAAPRFPLFLLGRLVMGCGGGIAFLAVFMVYAGFRLWLGWNWLLAGVILLDAATLWLVAREWRTTAALPAGRRGR